jgi:citrate synthase
MYMNAQQAADYLGVSRQTLYAYVSRGLLDSIDAGDDGRQRRYRKSDLERLRRRGDAASGDEPEAGDALHWGRPSIETDVGGAGRRGPRYRDTTLRQLLRDDASFAQTAATLWLDTDDAWRISADDLAAFDTEACPRHRPDNPLVALRLAAIDEAASRTPQTPRRDALRVVWIRLISRTARYWLGPKSASDKHLLGRMPPLSPAQLVAAIGLPDAPSTSSNVRLIDQTMTIVAEHGLNASTFAGRVAASTDAGLVDGVTAALAAFDGQRHGRHCEIVRQMVEALRQSDRSPTAFIESRIHDEDSLPGFGHPLYEHGDPRYSLLRDAIDQHGPNEPPIEVYDALTHAASASGLASPNLDVGLALLADSLELPPGHVSFIFAAGRLSGWLAHILEQHQRGELLRPRGRTRTTD